MPPKKRDKESETNRNPKIDPLQADHELFLQAFEKPTQIYRFLRTRNMLSPIFLNRTLSYMKRRMSRSNKGRTGFKVDSLLEKITLKKSTELQPNSLGGYMTLTFLGFYDKSLDQSIDYQVKVETLLLKICHKKRKESSSAIVEVSVGSCSVPLNPSSSEPPAMASAVSIAKPLVKRIKPSETNSSSTENKWTKLYGSELIVYDKHNRCLLTNGEYDLVLHDATPGGRSATIARSPHKALMAQWETIPSENDLHGNTNPFDIFKVRPLLKLKLSWSQEPTNGLVNRPKLYHANDTNGIKKGLSITKNRFCMQKGNGESKHIPVQQQLAATDGGLRRSPLSLVLAGLWHTVLTAQASQAVSFQIQLYIFCGARIDVSINELYDGSYTGSPHDLIAAQGRSSASGPRAGPTRRASLTHLLMWRPRARRRQQKHSLAEFLEIEDSDVLEAQRPYITGHNRLYHHTITCLPVYPNELDIDSESETDPLWLQQKTMMMIDEFTDVNEGEKELMKMWNLHVMKYNYVGDCQIQLACQMFLQMKGKELLAKNLYRNFILHVSSLHDFGLISAVDLYQTMQMLNQMLADSTEAKEKMRESLKAQREHWNAVGKFQQPVIIEAKPQVNIAKLNAEASPSVRRKICSLQNANRMGSSGFNKSSSPGPSNESKRKMSSGSIQSRKRSSISERKNSV
ncbi:unnamed protein product [Leptidea sinapis]|uniref:Polycomb protein VEFS-Box domain-containing protein n=1 Tax=Leptidea sinapis TaxID=189913 RepID=A0A5E4R209_9NEOP|nr:unnamed protein product [Leptidea sinapis]